MTDLWHEGLVGWAGRPSIQSLDNTWGHRWRRGNEVSFYSRRRLIIGEIRRLARQGGGRSALLPLPSWIEVSKVNLNAPLEIHIMTPNDVDRCIVDPHTLSCTLTSNFRSPKQPYGKHVGMFRLINRPNGRNEQWAHLLTGFSSLKRASM